MKESSQNSTRQWLNQQKFSFNEFVNWVDTFPLISIRSAKALHYFAVVERDPPIENCNWFFSESIANFIQSQNPTRETIPADQFFGYSLVLREVAIRTGVREHSVLVDRCAGGVALIILPTSYEKVCLHFGCGYFVANCAYFVILEWASSGYFNAADVFVSKLEDIILEQGTDVVFIFETSSLIMEVFGQRVASVLMKRLPNRFISVGVLNVGARLVAYGHVGLNISILNKALP